MKIPSLKIRWTKRRTIAAYAAFAALAFAWSLRATFPSEAVKQRLIMEAGQRGWQIEVDRVSAGGLIGARARGVKIETASGLAIPIEDVTASLRPLPLLIGRKSLSFDANLYDGRVRGTADLSGAERRLVVDVKGVDLGQALPLRKAAGVDLLGVVTGSADLTLPAAADKKPTGRVDLTVKGAGIAGGEIPIPGMPSGLPIPRASLGDLVAALNVGDGRATFEKLEATGGDAEIHTEGLYFLVQQRMEFAPLTGKARVKVGDAFWAKTPGMKGLAEVALAQSKLSDGTYLLSVTGSVGHPRLMPTQGSTGAPRVTVP
jgi:type II secretion system protein N